MKFRETNRKEFWFDNGLKEGTGIKISCKSDLLLSIYKHIRRRVMSVKYEPKYLL